MSDDHFGKRFSHKESGSNFDRLVPLALPKAFTDVGFTGKRRSDPGMVPLKSYRSVERMTLEAAKGRSNGGGSLTGWRGRLTGHEIGFKEGRLATWSQHGKFPFDGRPNSHLVQRWSHQRLPAQVED